MGYREVVWVGGADPAAVVVSEVDGGIAERGVVNRGDSHGHVVSVDPYIARPGKAGIWPVEVGWGIRDVNAVLAVVNTDDCRSWDPADYGGVGLCEVIGVEVCDPAVVSEVDGGVVEWDVVVYGHESDRYAATQIFCEARKDWVWSWWSWSWCWWG